MEYPVTVDYDNSRNLIPPNDGESYECTGYGIQFNGDISKYRDNFRQISKDIIGVACCETLPDFRRTKIGILFKIGFKGRSNKMPYILQYQNISHSEDILRGQCDIPVDKYKFSIVLEKTSINGKSLLCIGQHSIPKSNTHFNDTYHFETHNVYEVTNTDELVASLINTNDQLPREHISPRNLSSSYKPKTMDVIPDEIIAEAFRNESNKLLPVLL